MPAHDGYRVWSCAIIAAAATSVWWTLWVVTVAHAALAAAIVVQLVAAGLTAWAAEPRRTGLALALGIAVPAVGPLAALAATVRGRGGRELLHDPDAKAASIDAHAIARSLVGAPPPWEAVVSADSDARRASLANLSRRAGAGDLAILRWARSRCDGDLALEVSLALDEASERFEQRVAKARASADTDASYEVAAHAFRVLLEGIESGIVEPSVVARCASEARGYHDAAVARDRERAGELLVGRARLELADHQPDIALHLLVPSVARGEGGDGLTAVYLQAAFAARRFDLALGTGPGRHALGG